MFGNQSSNNFRLSNARLIGANCNASNNACEKSSFIDEDYSDYVVKANVPEMKLLPMDYVSKMKKPSCAPPPPPPAKCKCSSSAAPSPAVKSTVIEATTGDKNPMSKNSDKYLVYKKKHSIFGTAASPANEKLQYITGNKKKSGETNTQDPLMKAKENKKKYLIFENKKSSSKLDSIQYYFDNKSYEKYVDNKLYGKINRNLTPEPPKINEEEMLKGFENSRSWEWRDNSKTETKMKLFESKHEAPTAWKEKSDSSSSTSGASSCSEISLKRRNCRLKPQIEITESKPISDLSVTKTNNDVSRINQLFANAKPKQTNLLGNYVQHDKYKVQRKLNDKSLDKKIDAHECNVLMKDKLSSPELNIKTPDGQASCGFENCQLSHSSVPSLPVHTTVVTQSRRNFDENFIRKFEGMKKNLSFEQKNNEITVNESTISVNGRSNIIVNGTKTNFTPNTQDVYIINKSKEKIFNSKQSYQNTTTIKINDSGFVAAVKPNSKSDFKNSCQMNRNVIELDCGKASKWDKNIKLKNNPHLKFDNKVNVNNKIKSETNSVKIYVSGNDSPPSISSSQDSSDSDKDYGYFDTSSQGRSSSPEFVEMCKKFKQLCNVKSNLLGCDGTLFWNNSFFDEDEIDARLKTRTEQTSYHCTKCHTTTEDLLSNYICICSNQVINVIIALRKKNAHVK